ncbi:hypothetical protein INS49_001242 [Diaporthe citri]|uniref:uncharacterized protein n=1 Tax=Diaporthe citri TaxID=83186 RepID=UPI001C81B590|nr:uncharacterized protein INS49_001242 [Diaporthe citri]KAG6367060.1 hypothetical protein INS49_001242 [Diaporthe citri]
MSGSAPSTATVLEFRCLFTHDLRRKQKRWQDGRLKYHSFNARVMVYDERGNSVGDMHWHGEYDFGEGEEVQLDRGGVIVQVEELVERKETDLTELVDKRLQEKQQRQIQQLARSAALSAPQRHRPLHNVIGTPTGHHGKALVPKESPYEQRQEAAESPDDRAAKKRRYDDPPPSKSGYASALFGQTLTLSATPSSSVPAIRRPRPEARSDPPTEADARDARGDPKPARREQPQSSRRLNQSGYAQSLFGQTLTLSHTPVSSVPSLPQPHNEPASSPVVDNDRQDPRDTARPVPPQHPSEPRHLGQPGSKPRSALLSAQTSMGNGLAKGSADIEFSKAHAKSIEIIEIDDPEPAAPPLIRKPRTQKTTLASLRNPEEDVNNSDVAAGPLEDSVRSRRQQRLEPGRGDKNKKAKSHDRTKKHDITVSKANVSNVSSDRRQSEIHENVTRATAVTKDPALPVTELRIKSSKKRGLLMISDTSKAKKTRRQVAADSARPFEGSSRHQSRDSDDDDPFHSPSSRPANKFGNGRDVGESANNPPTVSSHVLSSSDDDENYPDYPILNRGGQWENEEAMGELGKKSAQRTISTELGEDDDPFRSSSPAIPEQTHARPKPATRDSDMQLGYARPDRVETTAQNRSDPGLSARSNGSRGPGDAVQPMKHTSLSRAGSDPYRIPSSPQASSPGDTSSAQRKRHGNDVCDEILRPMDDNKKLSKAKKQRHSRRKIISDEDNEDDTEMLASLPKKSDSGSESEDVAASRLNEGARKKQTKSRKATSTKTSAQEDPSMVESDDERPKRAARKSRGQQKELENGSDEDELPIKRRQSTRQRRSRAASYEEPSPLPSGQDCSEEEEIPRKRRKTKTSRASEDHPRLEKIKKNVKSRELVGFNLAALNAPLGLRGIGMPFSILPSPVNETVQGTVSIHAAVDETLSPVTVRGDDQMLPPSPNPPEAPFEMKAEAQRKSSTATSNRETPGRVLLAPSGSHVIKRNTPDENLLGELGRLDGPGDPRLPEDHASKKLDAPAANSQSSGPVDKDQVPVQDASSSKQRRASRQQPGPSKPKLAAQQHDAAALMLRDSATGTSSKHSLPSLNHPVQEKSATLPRQSSTGVNDAMPEDLAPEVPTKTVTGAQPSPAPAPATKPSIHIRASLEDRPHANNQQPSRTVQATGDKTKGATEAIPAENITADPCADRTPKQQAATPLNQQKPGIRKQPSTLGRAHASNTVESNPTVPTGAPIIPSATDKPESTLNRHSLNTGDQNSATVEKAADNPESDTASDLPVPQSKVIGLRREFSAPRRINNIAAKLAAQAETSETSSTDVHTKPASNARLANPASRGRKAALASHAAGQVPQRVLPPTQPALMVPISTADLAMTPIEQAPKEPERPKKKMTFPGFQSARSDGPWSREAFDLLESGRPD